MLLPVSLAFLASAPASNAPALVPVSQLLETYADSLTTYKATSKTKVGDLRPLVTQRGVTLDGALRAAPMLPMHLAADPFENVWVGHEKQGDLRIDIGAYGPSEVDIALPSTGWSWVVGRSFNARQTDSGGSQFDSDGPMGRNWALSSQPEIVLWDDATNTKDVLYLVYRADAYVEFDRTGTSSNEYKGKNGAAGCFHYVSGGVDTWEYTDQQGYVFTFLGFNTSGNSCNGLLWKVVDPNNNTAYVGDASSASTAISNGWDGSGRITKAYDTSDRRYSYSYSSVDSVTRLTQVKAETKTGGTWASPTGLATVAKVDYTYFANGDASLDLANGSSGDLKKATVTQYLDDSGVTQRKERYYRYWKGTYNSSSNPGYPHALWYAFDFEGVRVADWADNASLDDSIVTTAENTLKPYAAAHFEYDSSHRVRSAWFNGQCGCSGGGGNGTYSYAYDVNPAYTDNSGYDTAWATRTSVAKPDASYVTQYFDELGQGLSSAVTNIAASIVTPTPSAWVSYIVRDSNGCATEIHMPDNVTGYTHNNGGGAPDGSISTSLTDGLVLVYTRTSSGDLTGFVTEGLIKQGSQTAANGNSLYYQNKTVWDATTLTKTITGVKVVRPLVSATRTYPNKGTTDTSYRETTYGYTGYSSTLMPEKVTTTLPIVSTGNNGSGTANVRYVHYLKDGTVNFVKNEDATIDYFLFTAGIETKRIEDADTAGLSPPTGFASSGTPLKRSTATSYTAQGFVSSRTLNVDDVAGHRNPQTYRSALADGRMIILDFPDLASGSYYGPVQFSVVNQAGRTEVSGVSALSSTNSATTGFVDESKSDPLLAITVGSVAQMHTTVYDDSGARAEEERDYFLIPGSGAGSAGTNYDATTYGYDNSGRRWRAKEPSGTIYRTAFDAIGRKIQEWTGTNDHSFSGGETSGTDNMVKTRAISYDSGGAGKNSQVDSVTDYVEGSTTGQRVTNWIYDWRGHRIVELPPTAPYIVHKYDNEGREVARGAYGSSSGLGASSDPTSLATNRKALSVTAYDELGRVWKTTRHKIDQADGSDDDTLDSLTWYDASGRVIKVRGEQYRKTIYDRLGRVTDEYVLASDNDSGAYSAAGDVSGDIVLDEYQSRYDETKSDVLMSVTVQRMHNDFGASETTGKLDANGDGLPLKVTATNLHGRAQITAYWYDQFGRQTDAVEYGTFSGGDFNRSGLSAPTRSDLALRTTTAYNTDGSVDTVTDARALVAKYVYDALGRRTKEIKNYNSGVNSGNPYGTDQNVTVSYGYANGLRTSLTAVMPSGGTDQVTTYIYGTTTGTPSAMKISTGHLLRAVKYPDSTNAGTTQAYIDGTSDADVVSYAYNAQGQETLKKDQAGNILESVYDDSGRRTIKKATTIISGFDDAVKRVETGYDSLGRTSSVVQYDATSSGSATDGVAYTFDDWGNVASYAEDKDSAVSGGGNQYTTSYTWTKATTGRYTVCKTGMTMPDSRSIGYTPSSTGGLHDDEDSRVTLVTDGAVTLAQYAYLGEATVVQTKLNEISCMSRVFNDSNAIVDLDLFNRITTSRWTKDLGTDRDFYQVALTYDRDSNITSALDGVHGNYNSVGTRWDVAYTMDNVNRLTEAKEGTLSGGTITSPARDEQWTLSHTGNWDRAKLNLNGDTDFTDAGELDDSRTHNAVNELTARDTDSNGSANYSPSYDAAGNMTDDAKDYKYVYDVWNRLRQVKTTVGSVLVAEYRYNGLNHRIGVHEDVNASGTVDGSDPWSYDVFDERWRQLARYSGSESTPREDFVPHQAGASGRGGSSYIDLVICRNKDTDVNGSLEERTYLCQNWRADVSAVVKLVGSAGTELREWVKYSAYGTPIGLPGGDTDSDGDCDLTDFAQVQTWINGSTYDVRGDIDLDGDVDLTDKGTIRNNYVSITLGRGALSASNVVNRKGYAGYEALSGLAGEEWLARNRVLAADLGRWLQRDPKGYTDGHSLLAYVGGEALGALDPFGAEAQGGPARENPDDWGNTDDMSFGDRVKALVDATRVIVKKPSLKGEIEGVGRAAASTAATTSGGDPKNPNGRINNFMRHCMASCYACKKLGRKIAIGLAIGKEIEEGRRDSAAETPAGAPGHYSMIPRDKKPEELEGRDIERDWIANKAGLRCCKPRVGPRVSCYKCCYDSWESSYASWYPSNFAPSSGLVDGWPEALVVPPYSGVYTPGLIVQSHTGFR